MNNKKICLNFGCGDDVVKSNKNETWINYDLVSWKKYKNVKKIDLNVLPYNIPDDFADRIRFYHICEHLVVDLDSMFKEFSRILKKDGILDMKVPIYSRCMHHKVEFFDLDFFNGLWKLWKVKPNKESFHSSDEYRALHFDLVSRKVNRYWSGGLWVLSTGYKMLERFYSWILSFGYQEWHYVLRNIKDDKKH